MGTDGFGTESHRQPQLGKSKSIERETVGFDLFVAFVYNNENRLSAVLSFIISAISF